MLHRKIEMSTSYAGPTTLTDEELDAVCGGQADDLRAEALADATAAADGINVAETETITDTTATFTRTTASARSSSSSRSLAA